MRQILADLRFAARLLRKSPAFSVTAVVSLSVGLAASTAVFSLADGLLLRPRPGVGAPDRLIDLGRTDRGVGFDTISYPNYADYRDRNDVFSGVAAYRIEPMPLSLDARNIVDRVFGMVVSANYFDVLRVRPSRGRAFLAVEADPGDPHPVAVLSDRLWRRRFDADPAVVGSIVRLNSQPVTVVGIAPPGFLGTTVLAADLWLPLSMQVSLAGSDRTLGSNRRASWLLAVARLKPGVTIAQAQASMTMLSDRLARQYPDANRDRGIRLEASSRIPGEFRAPVSLFMQALALLVGLVMVTACSNVAGMLLARAAARQRELAIRSALGATRARLARQLLTETMLIFAAGGAGGVLLAAWLVRLLASFLPVLPVSVMVDLHLDARVLAFGFGLAMATGLLFGVLPACQSSSVDLMSIVKSQSHGVRRLGLRSLFVVGQVALALVLLISASLFLRALQRASAIDPGFNPAGVDAVFLDLRMGGYSEEAARAFLPQLLERVRALPGVERVATAGVVPMGGGGLSYGGVRVPGGRPGDDPNGLEADWNVVSPDYFRTLEIPLVAGRTFSAAEVAAPGGVAIVNQAMAARLWPDHDPIGRSFEVMGQRGVETSLRVVGVARDSKYRWIGDRPRLFVYIPFGQERHDEQALLIRRRGSASTVPGVRRLLRELSPGMPMIQATTLEAYGGVGLLPQRLAASVAGGLGMVGLLLAALGVYGVTSYNAAQRTRELGIRIALGADRAGATRLMLWHGLRLAVPGAAIGAVAAAALGPLFGSLLLGVGPVDPLAFVAALTLLVSVATVASYVPARRAAAADPVDALKAD